MVKDQDGSCIGASINEDYFFDEFDEQVTYGIPKNVMDMMLIYGFHREYLYKKEIIPGEKGKVFHLFL